MRRSIFCLIAVTMLSIAVAGESAEKPAALTLKDMQGKKATLRDLRGKIVVFNFWATWCGPCNAEMPRLVSAANSYDSQRVAFVGASVDAVSYTHLDVYKRQHPNSGQRELRLCWCSIHWWKKTERIH